MRTTEFTKIPILSEEEVYDLAYDRLDLTSSRPDRANDYAERMGMVWSDEYDGYIDMERVSEESKF